MLADYRVCLDACVLANYAVSDLLLRLAERPRIYTPVFSEMIITFNLKDFKGQHLEQWGIESRHPQDYLITLFEMKPELVISRLHDAAAKHDQTPQQRLAKLSVALPRFTEYVAEEMDWSLK